MPKNPPENMPRITAYLLYHDVVAALDWLTRTFGFKERMRMKGPDGVVSHGEIELADGVVMMGRPDGAYKNPKQLGQATQMLYVYVDQVDQHFERAKKAGAKILKEPEDQFYGDRRYAAEDPEGHHWFFATHVKDVAPEDMKVPA
jgi:PhnB protein